jgi:hypothetical protein
MAKKWITNSGFIYPLVQIAAEDLITIKEWLPYSSSGYILLQVCNIVDLGVSIGELDKKNDGYSIKSAFSKKLLKPDNDTWKAFFQARVEIFYDYIIKTPAFLKENKKFDFSHSYGELFARSSRTVEPILRVWYCNVF